MSFTFTRDLRLAVAAKAISLLGDEVATIALVLRLQHQGAGAVAAVLMANLVPIVLLSGVVGRLVDRLDRRRLLAWSGAAQIAVCVAMTAVASPVVLIALIGVLGIGQAVNGATWQALLPSLATPDELPRALGLAQAAVTSAGIAAPALAGVLSGAFGTRVPLLLDAVSFGVVTVVALCLRGGGHDVLATRARARGGLAIVRADATLRAVFTLLGTAVLLGSAVNVVEVFLVRETLHADATWFGLSGASFAVGLLGGALAGGRLPAARHRAALVASAAGLSLGLVAIGLSPTVGWLLAGGVFTGFANGVLNVCSGTLVMSGTAPNERGRVSATLGAIVAGTQLAAYAGGGTLATVLGPREIFLGAGIGGLLAPLLLGRAVLATAVRAAIPGGIAACRAGVASASPSAGYADFSRRSRLGGSRGTSVG